MTPDEIEIGRDYRRIRVRNTAGPKIVGYRVTNIFTDPAYADRRIRYAPIYADGQLGVVQTCGESYFAKIAD